MVNDLVVDTNVLVHASNKSYCKQIHCIQLIERLQGSLESICMDTNGFIEFEYNKHVKHGSPAFALLLQLLNSNPVRIKYIDRDIPPHVNNKINRTGIKKSDRIFVRIAFNSTDKILVTHDYEDFTSKKRGYFNEEIGVRVIESEEFNRDF